MYKNYPEFKKLKIYYDPNFLLVSEMTNRLFSDFYNHKCWKIMLLRVWQWHLEFYDKICNDIKSQ